jgi:chromosome segregation ATPase
MTITEALAEIKTIGKRIEKKRESLQGYLARQENIKDPLDKDGGSVAFVQREMQAISDLEERIVTIRAAIAQANATTNISLNGSTRSVADWLVWRREIAPARQRHLESIRRYIDQVRQQVSQQGRGLVNATVNVADAKPTDVLVNVSETDLLQEIEALEEMLGSLDGQLSLKNATVKIKV